MSIDPTKYPWTTPNPRIWRSNIRLDTREVLNITAPLVVVMEAVSRTLTAIEPAVYQTSILEIKLEAF